MKWQQYLLVLVTVSLLLVAGIATATAAELEVNAAASILIEANTGTVIFANNADQPRPMASVTKLMTMLLTMEAVAQGSISLEDEVQVSENAASYGGSQVFLEPGEVFPLEKMLLAVAVGSANDASVAVAEHIAGSEEAFVEKMNQRASELGLKNTKFANSHGLPAKNHYSSAHDLAVIAREALRYPKLMEMSATKYVKFREDPLLELWNLNKLLWWYPGADGLKTGTTAEAGRCLVATAERDGLRLISVVLGVDRPRGHFSEAMKVLSFGFARHSFHQFYDAGAVVTSIPVNKGKEEKIDLVAPTRVGAMVVKGKTGGLTTQMEVPAVITAPLAEGQLVGSILVMRDGVELLRVPLLASRGIERNTLWGEIARAFKLLV